MSPLRMLFFPPNHTASYGTIAVCVPIFFSFWGTRVGGGWAPPSNAQELFLLSCGHYFPKHEPGLSPFCNQTPLGEVWECDAPSFY